MLLCLHGKQPLKWKSDGLDTRVRLITPVTKLIRLKFKRQWNKICSLCVGRPHSLYVSVWQICKVRSSSLLRTHQSSHPVYRYAFSGVCEQWSPPLPFPAILISIGSLSIYQMTVAALCRAQRDIGLEPQRKKNKNPDAGKLAWYRQPLHFPSPSEEDGHNRLPDNTRTHRARSSRFFF